MTASGEWARGRAAPRRACIYIRGTAPALRRRMPRTQPQARDQHSRVGKESETHTAETEQRLRPGRFLRVGKLASESGVRGRAGCRASRHELQARGRGGGRGAARGVVGRLRWRRLRRRRGGPLPGRRARPARVRAAAAAEDELGQHLRHDVHDVAAPAQEGPVSVLRGQVPVVRVHVGGALPGGPAQEGQPLQAEGQIVQELRRAGRDGQEALLGLLRQPQHRGRQRLQDAADSERVPSVVGRRLAWRALQECFCS